MNRRWRHHGPPHGRHFGPHHGMRHYVRSHMHRRLFAWFGASIFVTGLAFAIAMHLLDRANGSPWVREVQRVQTFVGNRFGDVWDRPAERDKLARDAAKDLDLDLRLVAPDGSVLSSFGACERPRFRTPVIQDGRTVGEVQICAERHTWGGPWRTALPLILAGLVLWGMSGRIARRIASPLGELARVAREIGDGNLRARTDLSCQSRFDEVGLLAEAINDMAGKIERQMADQRELLAGVSHELRTPLSRIRLLVEIGRDTGVTPKTLDDIDSEVVEIDSLVGELLASSRLEFSAITPSRLDGVDLARRALNRLGLDAAVLQTDAPEAPFDGDATLVARALANVLDNAKKHGRGVKRFAVTKREGRIAFEVDDAGPGFPAGAEEKVFEPFYRGQSGRGADQGSLGLGLALVRRIARAHGGEAWAKNLPEGGARVGFEVRAA